MTRAAPAVLAVALVALVWSLLHVAWYPHGQIVDYGVYQHYGDGAVRGHEVPYRDFAVEYPPGALPVFVIPSYLEHFDYRRVFQAEMALCLAAAVLAVLAVAGRRAAVLAAIAPLALGSVVLSRFDLWPAALVAVSLALLVRGNLGGSAVLLGTGFAAKLWPAVLAPLVVVYLWRRAGRRPALEWLGAAVATVAAWFLPFVVLSPGGVGHSFHQQIARPLQIESLGASFLIALHHVAGTSVRIVTTFGSQNLVGPGTHTAAAVTAALEALAVIAVWVLFARGEPSDERLLLSAAALVTALLAFGKVFSPQFLIWLIPLVPLVRNVAARVLFLGALVVTQLYFPRRYWHIGAELRPRESWELFARNLVVVALFGVLLYLLHRSRAASSELSSAAVSARRGARTSV